MPTPTELNIPSVLALVASDAAYKTKYGAGDSVTVNARVVAIDGVDEALRFGSRVGANSASRPWER